MYKPDRDENRRLKLQNELLDLFDYDVYKEVLEKYTSSDFLDIGCGSGAMIIPKISRFGLGNFLGIDISELQIGRAREKFNDERIRFECLDAEADDFEEEFKKILKDMKTEKFDVISFSMVLLHMKNPSGVLGILHKYLKDDGHIIIRDIDDGLNFASPDPDSLFERIYNIASMDDIAGNRYMGRNIYHCLEKAGYKNIELKKEGLSTIGLDDEHKEAFYEMSFKAMMERTEIMLKNHPGENKYLENYEWVKANKEKVTEEFMRKDFAASLGFMSFTAGK